MASILRSSKFVRYIAGFARNIVVNTPREFDGNLVNTTQCLCGAVPRSFATQATAQHEQNLDSCLRRLDQDVRRSGRISRRDIEDVLEEIRNARSASSSQSLLVIRCCGNLVPEEMPEIRTKLVQEIWNTLRKLNVPMDVSHYNALLRVYLENEHDFVPTQFLSELENHGIEPNRVTYQRLIARYCQVGDIEGATKILEYMREKQLPVNENVFNALINGHSQAGDMDSACGILSVMTQAGLEPSADTYTTLLCGYAKKGDIESIDKYILECEQKEIFLLDKDYLDIVYALSVNGHSQHISKVLNKTRKAFGYSQDAINIILRLINKHLEDDAYVILKTIPRGTKSDGSQYSIGVFFIKQMVKADTPLEKIIQICDNLEKDELYHKGITFAAETALQIGNENLAYPLLEIMKQKGISVRQHYFWPLIISKTKDNSDDSIINVLMEMTKFGLTPNAETIREYVLPNMKGQSSEIIAKLRNANISIGAAACSLVYSLLQKNNMKEAAEIMQTVGAYYYPELIRKPLSAAFHTTKNIEAFGIIVRHVYENLDKKADVDPDDQTTIDKNEVVSKFLLDLANHNKRVFTDEAEKILQSLVDQGLSISTIGAEKIEEKIGEKMTPEISKLLSRLSSGELIPVPIERKFPSYTPSHQMNIPQLERLITNLEMKKQDTKGLRRQLMTLYYRSKEFDKMEELYKTFEKDSDFKYTTGIYAQLLDTCAFHERYDDTVKYLQKMQEIEENYTLDESKVIRVVLVLVKNNKLEEALKFLERPRDPKPEERNFNYNSLCWRLLNQVAETGNVNDLERLFDAMTKNDYLEINNVNLGPLVKVHLVNKDIDKALEKFEWCCTQFRATPWKNDLACHLIQAEDADKLQRLTDLSTSVHGEINSLYDLVFAFVECGRIRQARKILETPGLQNRPQRINFACQRYQQEGKVKPLEGLREATKDLNHIDRSDIYHQLLLSYIKQNDTEKSLALWTQMQEEDMAPNDEFLKILGDHLIQKGLKVPFTIPIAPKKLKTQKPVQQPQESQQPEQKKDVTLFRQHLKNGDLDQALNIRKISKESFTMADTTLLIEKLVQSDRQQEATAVTIEMLNSGNVPLTRVFRFLLNKLANTGDVESIEQIGQKINSETKKLVSFDNRICHANLVAGKADVYLAKLENEIDEAKNEDLEAIGEKFPRGGAVGILERYPHLLEKYEQIAFKYAKRGIIAPVNVLWSHYFINNEETKAEDVWKTYLQGAPRIMFQRVVQYARETNDEILTQKLIEHLKTSKVTDGALGNAYSCLLDVLYTKQKYEEAVNTFETSLKSVAIEYINRTAIIRVKECFDKLEKPFKYTIPPKNVKNQTSSSSSSSEEEAVKK